MELKIKSITKNENGIVIGYTCMEEKKEISIAEFLNIEEVDQSQEYLKRYFEFILPKLANNLFNKK